MPHSLLMARRSSPAYVGVGVRAKAQPARIDKSPMVTSSRRGRGSFPSGSHRRDRMLTPKKNGPAGDFFNDEPPRRHDELVGFRQRKPLSQILREEREHRNVSLPEV